MKRQAGHDAALEGLKVVEFAHMIAGPFAGTLLADLGADVIHVESPNGGDGARNMGPDKDGTKLWWKVAARNKRSLALDLGSTAGRAVARRLVEWADVVIVNMRVHRLRAWGLDWESCHQLNDTLIYCQISGYGVGSAMEDQPGFGKVGEARAGLVALTGFSDGPPMHSGFSHADTVTGLMAAFGISAALYRKAQDDEFDGEWIDLALFESLYRLIEWQVIVYDQLGTVPRRTGNMLPIVPGGVVNTYRTADDKWVTVTAATPKAVSGVARVLSLAADAIPSSQPAEISRWLDDKLRAWINHRNAAEAVQLLGQEDVVASPIFTVEDIMTDPTYRERADIASVVDDDLGLVRMQSVIPKLHKHPGAVWRTGPPLGADTELILDEWLNINAQDRAELFSSNVAQGNTNSREGQ